MVGFPAATNLFDEIGERLRDIRTGPDGALYILSEGAGAGDGRVWRVRATNRQVSKIKASGVDAHRPMAYNADIYLEALQMAVPKRKVTRSRRGKRRSADALSSPTYGKSR